MTEQNENLNKSNQALREEAVLAFWKAQNIFQKSLEKESPNGEFVFYEGPPTANAKPALHHLEARAFKDVMPRYKTMQGFHVARRAGWDTHGLPVELQIEKSLGLQSKKEIETYGIAKFNKECKDSVFTYIKDWENFTDRIGYWVDQSNAYYTFNPSYMESLWNIIGEADKKDLLYKDYKVIPYCPRCGTTLASHELAQGYQDDKDLSVTAKFKVKGQDNTYLLAWTTTPWTLPGNVALAVGKDIAYVKIKVAEEYYILAQERLSLVLEQYTITESYFGKDLVGLEYEPLYSYLSEIISGDEKEKMSKAYQVYAADFVTTTDGTGIVHTAVMYGQEDFELGTKVGLPKFHTVDDTGRFVPGTDFLEGRFVKDEEVAIDIIKDLAHRGLLFKKEKYEHSYPHCWRCKTPLIYYARDSWYIAMSKLRDGLVSENNSINWNPEHIRDGRFGEWLREVKDWAISRERYWGTPLPVWIDDQGEKLVVNSVDTLKKYTKKSGNTYFVMRHGQTDHNVREEWNCDRSTPDPLTELGISQVVETAKSFEGEIDLIITSPFNRTKETSRIFSETKGIDVEIIEDERLREWSVGQEFNGKPFDIYFKVRNNGYDRYNFKTPDGESYIEVLIRAADFIYDIETKYQGKRILIVTHGGVARAIDLHSRGIYFHGLFEHTRNYVNFENADLRQVNFVPLPHNENYELDLHKPYIDNVVLENNNKQLTRVKEVMDVWFDSGSMPFAQDHFPFAFEKGKRFEGKDLAYPADFISEAIDQTRGWFYTLHAVGAIMGRGKAYKNVICLGHLLDKDGKKMSKSIGNIVEPFEQINKFGVDAVRFWMYSVNQPGESKNYDEKSVAEINNKVFNLLGNVYSFYELYRDKSLESEKYKEGKNVLDQWIISRLNQLVSEMAESLDSYDLFRPTRSLRDFIDDLSTWYLRRSRDRLKDGDESAKQTLYHVLKTMSQLLAPFAPFTAEDMWLKLKTEKDEESVHLSEWPKTGNIDENVISEMKKVRDLVTKGLELRQKSGIKIRQPLQSFSIEDKGLKNYYEIMQDELNVKKILNGELSLDINITPDLKVEGMARELMRAIQDMRKQRGLMPDDVIELSIGTNEEGMKIIKTFESDIKKVVGAKSIDLKEDNSGEIKIEEIPFSISF